MAYDTIIPPDFYTSGGWGPGVSLSGGDVPANQIFDLDSQQTPGDTSYGDNQSGLEASYWGTNSPGCVYQSAACFAWTEGLGDGTSYGIYVGSYDGTTFVLLGGPIDAGATVTDPVVATDGANLYLAYRKQAGSTSGFGYEVWMFDGASWTHLYTYAPTRIADNRTTASNVLQGTSGPRLAASPEEPEAVYVGFKEFGPDVDNQATHTRVVFTVTGLGPGATVPGETVVYDDSEPGGVDQNIAPIDRDWLGCNLEFQVANDGGRPVALWNAPAVGPGRWVDDAWHLVDVATLTDIAAFASQIGDATYGDVEPVGAQVLTQPLISSFPAALIAGGLYSDPAYSGADTWIFLLKFVSTGTGQGEWLIVSVRIDGNAWHILDDNPAYANGLAPLDGGQGAAFGAWVDGDNVWLLCQNWTGAATVPQFFVMQLERQCNQAWIVPYENEFVGPTLTAPGFVWCVLLGDAFRCVSQTPDFHLLGTAPPDTFDTAWYSLKICRGCASCQRGLHVWQRL